jgi:hypothetical protein
VATRGRAQPWRRPRRAARYRDRRRVTKYRGPTYPPGATRPPQKSNERSEQDIERLRQDVHDHPVSLPTGLLARFSCGRATEWPSDLADIIRMRCLGREGKPTPHNSLPTEIAFARCRDCAERDSLATQLVAEHRSLPRRFGTESAVHRLSCALDGLGCARDGLSTHQEPSSDRTLRARSAGTHPPPCDPWICRSLECQVHAVPGRRRQYGHLCAQLLGSGQNGPASGSAHRIRGSVA